MTVTGDCHSGNEPSQIDLQDVLEQNIHQNSSDPQMLPLHENYQ
jgi:hypothetical protein